METLIFPFASQRPTGACDLQNGLHAPSKGTCPNSRPLEQSISNSNTTCAWAPGSLFSIQARRHCCRRPRSRLCRDGPVATIAARPPDNAVHVKNCLVLQPRLRRSLLDHRPFHRHCWLAIGRRPFTRPRLSQEAPHTAQCVAFAGEISVSKFSDCPSNWAQGPVRNSGSPSTGPQAIIITSPPLKLRGRASERTLP